MKCGIHINEKSKENAKKKAKNNLQEKNRDAQAPELSSDLSLLKERKEGSGYHKTTNKPAQKREEKKEATSLTALTSKKISDEVLHQAVLLSHSPLEADHLNEHIFVIPLQVANPCPQVLALLFEPLDLRRQTSISG